MLGNGNSNGQGQGQGQGYGFSEIAKDFIKHAQKHGKVTYYKLGPGGQSIPVMEDQPYFKQPRFSIDADGNPIWNLGISDE